MIIILSNFPSLDFNRCEIYFENIRCSEFIFSIDLAEMHSRPALSLFNALKVFQRFLETAAITEL